LKFNGIQFSELVVRNEIGFGVVVGEELFVDMVDFDVFYNGDLFIGLVFDHSLKGASLWDLLVSKVL